MNEELVDSTSVRVDPGNPVWAVYDKWRTARLNYKYYCHRLMTTERFCTGCEIILLFTAPSSAIAGLWFWQSVTGALIWKWLGAIAAIVAVLKPIFWPTKRIKDLENVVSGYRMLEYDLNEIVDNIRIKQKYGAELQREFQKAIQREKTLVSKAPETREVVGLKIRCENEVRSELPNSSFYVPEN